MRIRALHGLALAAALVLGAPAAAQPQTLADIKAELTVLNGQIEQLRNELVRSGSSGGLPVDPASALTRLDQLEAELRRLTDRVDVLTNDVERIVEDATNHVGDIEFRLTELEGGDTSVLDRARAARRRRHAAAAAADRAVGGPGRHRARWWRPSRPTSTRRWRRPTPATTPRRRRCSATFLQTYPGGPLSTEAQFRRGEALAAQADWRGAARSFLDAFSGAPQDPLAPRALYRLAVSLGKLGQTEEACLTLTEVDSRYPGSGWPATSPRERQALACP